MSQTIYGRGDEIDFFQLVEDVWKGRWLVVGITSVVLSHSLSVAKK